MAFTTVEDLTGTMELLIFPRVLAGVPRCPAGKRRRGQRPRLERGRSRPLNRRRVQPIEHYDPSQSFGKTGWKVSAARPAGERPPAIS